MSSIYPNVELAMKERGMSQRKLHDEMVGVGYVISYSSLSLKLNGKRSIFIDEMQLIADILNKDPVHLFFCAVVYKKYINKIIYTIICGKINKM